MVLWKISGKHGHGGENSYEKVKVKRKNATRSNLKK